MENETIEKSNLIENILNIAKKKVNFYYQFYLL